jgi:hypothetical protein
MLVPSSLSRRHPWLYYGHFIGIWSKLKVIYYDNKIRVY